MFIQATNANNNPQNKPPVSYRCKLGWLAYATDAARVLFTPYTVGGTPRWSARASELARCEPRSVRTAAVVAEWSKRKEGKALKALARLMRT